jgi:DNA-binding transcriptional LysR family regulator
VDVGALEAFLLVAERGSFSLAARELGLTQPGVSRQVQKLERSLRTVLFVRAAAGVRLTPAGERYRAFAQDVLARHQQLLADISGAEAVLEGELRIAASTTPGEFLVPGLVAEFSARHPGVRAVVFTTDSEEVVAALLGRRWDVGFAGAHLGHARLRFEPLADDEVVLAVPAHHPFAARAEVALDDLAEQRFVEREGGSGTLLSVRRALAQRGLALPAYRVSMTLSTTQAIVAAVRAGYGIGFVSSLALLERPDSRVVTVRLAGLPLRRKLYLVREERRVLPLIARHFADFALTRTAGRDNLPP